MLDNEPLIVTNILFPKKPNVLLSENSHQVVKSIYENKFVLSNNIKLSMLSQQAHYKMLMVEKMFLLIIMRPFDF